jgi:hypothetical protein
MLIGYRDKLFCETEQKRKENFPRWTLDLSIKPKTLKLPEESTGENLHDFRLGEDYFRQNSNHNRTKLRRF